MLVERTVYGETRSNPGANNLRGEVIEILDQAGVITSDEYDFKGNLLRSQRQLARDYKEVLNWSAAVPLEVETYTSRTRYDALNRPTQLIAPHSDQQGAKHNVIQPGYNEANLLEQVNVWLDQNAEPADLLDPLTANLNAVTDIDYDAKGQRELIEYGNEVITNYAYDPFTYRLVNLSTMRGTKPLQDFSYTYDPVGNITHIQDDAHQTIYFNNAVVEPHADYRYDAIYRLIEATDREHIGQLSQPQTTWNDEFRVHLPHPNDGQAMRHYRERYHYDEVGNFLELIHNADDGNWTRGYSYAESSPIESGIVSNRLSRTTVGNTIESYSHDAHGNMTTMLHLPLMRWNYLDQLEATARQVVNNGTPETTYYVYDGSGKRVRKVTERHAEAGETPTRMKERVYLGEFEVYSEYDGTGATTNLERETLHLMDDQQRIALVETRTIDTAGSDAAPEQVIRYQFGNHLGSASLELDDLSQIISYEEYFPYGSTSYQGVHNQTQTPKRYRYTGKERDEETGLYYHGARYYACWLGRWTSADPAGMVDGTNLYAYVRGSPISFRDPKGTDRWYADTNSNAAEKRAASAQNTALAIAYTHVVTQHALAVVAAVREGRPAPPPPPSFVAFKASRPSVNLSGVTQYPSAGTVSYGAIPTEAAPASNSVETDTNEGKWIAGAWGGLQGIGWSSIGQGALVASPAGAMALGIYKLWQASDPSYDVSDVAIKATTGGTPTEWKQTTEAIAAGDPETIGFVGVTGVVGILSAIFTGRMAAGEGLPKRAAAPSGGGGGWWNRFKDWFRKPKPPADPPAPPSPPPTGPYRKPGETVPDNPPPQGDWPDDPRHWPLE